LCSDTSIMAFIAFSLCSRARASAAALSDRSSS
jgi:hypothetical protein